MRIHDDEPDVGEAVVRRLLRTELPDWSQGRLDYLASSGTSNAMWRLRLDRPPDLIVRLPRRPSAAANVRREVAVLEALQRTSGPLVKTPVVRHLGEPHESFPYHWSVLEWIDGTDAWQSERELDAAARIELAGELATFVTTLGSVTDIDLDARRPGQRGRPLRPLLHRLSEWLDDPQWNAPALLDVGAVRRLAAEAEEVAADAVTTGFVHGDLIPGNLLLDDGRLAAVIDWGSAGSGDVAQDLAPAWSVFDEPARTVFRDEVGADRAAWIRGRTFELEQAVGGVVYYVPKQHPLGDVMRRTLDRILAS